MPFFKSKKNKNRRTDGGGFTTYDDVYQSLFLANVSHHLS